MKLSSLAAASVLMVSMALPALGQAPAPARVGELQDRPVVDANGAKIADVYDVVVDTTESRAAYLVFSVGMKVIPVTMPSPEMVFTKDKVELAFPRGRLEGMPALDMAALGPRYKRGRDLIGTQLKDPNGVVLGDIKDLMIDLSNGNVAAVVIAFDPKVRQEQGWVAIPRESVRYEGGFVATFKLNDMRPAAEAQAEQQRFDAAKAAAATVDRDERFTELKGRSLIDPQGKVLGQIVDVVTDAAGTKALHALVNVGGSGGSSVALPLQGATRSGGNYVLPSGAAALIPAPASGKRLSEQIGKALVEPRGKEVGKVRDMIVNLGTGKVRYAVAEFEPAWIAAGYLVPIKVPGDDRKIELNALTGSMIFEGARWPDINNPQFIANMDAYVARQK